MKMALFWAFYTNYEFPIYTCFPKCPCFQGRMVLQTSCFDLWGIFEEFLSQTYMPGELNYHIFSLLKHEIKPDLVSCPKLHTVAAAGFEEMMDELELLQSFKSIYFKLFKFVQILLIFFSRRHTECWCASVSFICRTRLSVQVQMSAYLIFRWLTCLRELYR